MLSWYLSHFCGLFMLLKKIQVCGFILSTFWRQSHTYYWTSLVGSNDYILWKRTQTKAKLKCDNLLEPLFSVRIVDQLSHSGPCFTRPPNERPTGLFYFLSICLLCIPYGEAFLSPAAPKARDGRYCNAPHPSVCPSVCLSVCPSHLVFAL